MAKKITVKMLKEKKDLTNEFSSDEIKQLIEETIERADKVIKTKGLSDKTILEPFDIDDQVMYDFLAGTGFVIMVVIKNMMTPAAWKYYVEETSKEFKLFEE